MQFHRHVDGAAIDLVVAAVGVDDDVQDAGRLINSAGLAGLVDRDLAAALRDRDIFAGPRAGDRQHAGMKRVGE